MPCFHFHILWFGGGADTVLKFYETVNLKLFYLNRAVPICMPPDGADFTGKVATVSGWGRLKYGGGVPSVLQEVQVSI